MKYLELAGWKINSCDDGPGIRTVLFLQGCSLKCPGCHNEKIQEREGGYLMDLNQVYTEIIKKCHNKRLTISGGEPLEQWDSLKELLICLKKMDLISVFIQAGNTNKFLTNCLNC